MSVSFDSEWLVCDGPVSERFECVESEENSCALEDDDEELVSDWACARVPERRLEVDPPSESPRTSALRLLFMTRRVAFDEDDGFDVVEIDFGLGMLEEERNFEVDAALLPLEEAGLEEFDAEARTEAIEPTGAFAPVDLRLAIYSLRLSTPVALELTLRSTTG